MEQLWLNCCAAHYICFKLNAPRCVSSCVFYHKICKFVKSMSRLPSNLRRNLSSSTMLRVHFSTSTDLSFSPALLLLYTFRSQNYAPLHRLFSRKSRIAFFLIGGTDFVVRERTDPCIFYILFRIFSSSTVERYFLRSFSTFRVKFSNIVPLSR